MYIKGIVDEDFVNYKKPSMFIACHSCSFKCDKLNGQQVCQNGALASVPSIDVSINTLVNRYLENDITEAVVFGGLEPFDDIENITIFIQKLRHSDNNDDIVIYTGYTEEEIKNTFKDYYNIIKNYSNIIIKYGRYIMNQEKHFDAILGVDLSSNNQYSKKIS